MTRTRKEQIKKRFFKAAGPNAETFTEMFDAAPQLCLNIKDMKGRFIALNKRNCEMSNIRDEWDVIGLTSADIFPKEYADAYQALDEEVRRTGRPLLNCITELPTDKSKNFMLSNLYPIRNAAGGIIGTAHVYIVTSDAMVEGRRFRAMRDLADYIAAHLADDLSIATLADLVHMSPTSFKIAFAKTFHTSPRHYITNVRINAARRLLENTNKLIADIATECGFFDQSHFTRVFRQMRGITPGAYRRQHSQ